jgi:nucleoside-diphosphate-sugar epimerase
MKILITGAAGYLGSVLIDHLFSKHHDMFNKIIAVDNLMYKQTSLVHYCHRDDFEFHKLDVRDYDNMLPLIQKADVIIPLACIVGMPACKKYPELTVATNQEAIQWLTKVTRPDQKIIFPTTNSGYGIGQEGIYCTEETPLTPISLYGVTKVEAEKALLNNGNAVTFRLATVFGMSPRMRLDLLVNDFAYKAYKDKYIVLFESHFKRNFIHIRDVAKTFVFAIKNFDKMKGQTYNVGLSSANISKKELCEIIKTFIPDFYIAESEINEDPDKRNYIVSNDKLESLGWYPEYDLNAGIIELLKAYPIIESSNNNFTNL